AQRARSTHHDRRTAPPRAVRRRRVRGDGLQLARCRAHDGRGGRRKRLSARPRRRARGECARRARQRTRRRALGARGPAPADRSVKFAAAVLVLFVVVAVAAPAIAPHDPRATPQSETQKNLPPSGAHPFGTDQYSRDVMSRVIYGARVSLGVAVVAVMLALTLGAAIGAVAGYAGGWTDIVCMRVVDAMLSVPRVLLLLVLGEVRLLKERDYVVASRATGTPEWRVFVLHVLPGLVPQLLVMGTLALA